MQEMQEILRIERRQRVFIGPYYESREEKDATSQVHNSLIIVPFFFTMIKLDSKDDCHFALTC